MSAATLALLIGNRDFFPDRLVGDARAELREVFAQADVDVVSLERTDNDLGAVDSWSAAKRAADLLGRNRDRLDGIVVSLPNFGDEKAMSDAIRMAGLTCPVLLHAYPDRVGSMGIAIRRDAFCGKISLANNLTQMRIPFSLTRRHTLEPRSAEFAVELDKFIRICRVVGGMRRARVGVVGTRPDAFRTVRFSEKILEAAGISVSVIDLSDVYGRAGRISDDDPAVTEKISAVDSYVAVNRAPAAAMVRIAKLAKVLEDWIQENDLSGVAIQCWSSLQKNFGVNACSAMSMLSQGMIPAACEADGTGLVTMLTLQLASSSPAALVDWNNNYGEDEDKCVFFHCGNWASDFVPELEHGSSELLGTTLGIDNTFGALSGRASAGPITFGRVSTDDLEGRIKLLVGEGEMTDDPADTFGTYGVVQIPDLQRLLRQMCQSGFEHHAAMTRSHVAAPVVEAAERYLGWSTQVHRPI